MRLSRLNASSLRPLWVAAALALAAAPAMAHDHDRGGWGDHHGYSHERNLVVGGALAAGVLAGALLDHHTSTVIYATQRYRTYTYAPYGAYGYAPYDPYGYAPARQVIVPPPTIIYTSPVPVPPPAPYGSQQPGGQAYGGYGYQGDSGY